MRERHADTVRFHKSHRPKMTVVRLVIGLLLLVFPAQLTVASEETNFSYVIDLSEKYAKIDFYRNLSDSRPIDTQTEVLDISETTSTLGVYIVIETNLSPCTINVSSTKFHSASLNIDLTDFKFELSDVDAQSSEKFESTGDGNGGQKLPQGVTRILDSGNGRPDTLRYRFEYIFLPSFWVENAQGEYTATLTVEVTSGE